MAKERTVFEIVCETQGCEYRNVTLNRPYLDGFHEYEEAAVAEFMESFGRGGEEEADVCPKCGKLGILQDWVGLEVVPDRPGRRSR